MTKDFSNTGVAIVLEQPLGLEQAILGFRLDGEMTFVRAEAKHLNPMGGGFFQLGFQLLEVVSTATSELIRGALNRSRCVRRSSRCRRQRRIADSQSPLTPSSSASTLSSRGT